jgi:hypothetical protein
VFDFAGGHVLADTAGWFSGPGGTPSARTDLVTNLVVTATMRTPSS